MDDKVSFHIYDENLTGQRYLEILRSVVSPFLEELPLNLMFHCWYQLDGAPAHCTGPVTNELNAMFGERWIRLNGPLEWPPRSPDLTPLDFYLWGTIKSEVYKNNIDSKEELEARVRAALRGLPPAQIRKATSDGVRRRIDECMAGQRQLKYYCPDCLSGIKLIPKLLQKIDSMQAEIDSLKDRIQSQQDDEAIIGEVYERQRRQNNVMFYNLPESDKPDLAEAKDILMSSIERDIVRAVRVGKPNKNGARALRVTLSSPDDAHKVLKNKIKIGKARNIFIDADLSPRQLQHLQKVRKEAADRRSGGEEVYIRYVGGAPRVFAKNQSDRNLMATGVTRGGGVLLAVRDDCDAVELSFPDRDQFHNIDIVGVKVIFRLKTVYIFVVYIPPNINPDQVKNLLELLESLHYLYDSNLLVIGDFNQPLFTVKVEPERSNNLAMLALGQFVSFYELVQSNCVTNDFGRLLDLAFSNLNCKVCRDSVPFVSEDCFHPALDISVEIKTPSADFPYNTEFDPLNYNFRKANFAGLYSDLADRSWNFLGDVLDVNVALDIFYSILYDLLDRHVPRFSSCKKKYPPWFNQSIIRKIKEKDKVFRKLRKFNLDSHRHQFANLRRQIKNDIRMAYSQYVKYSEESIINDPSKFWSFIEKKKGCSRIPGILNYDGVELSSGGDIVDAFASFFSSVFTISDAPVNLDNLFTSNRSTIGIESFSESEVITALKRVKNDLTSGNDGIPGLIIRDCASVLAAPLLTIFNRSLETSCFPEVWKICKVIPVHKKGNKSIQNILIEEQHGFVPKRSTVTNLITFTQIVCNALEDKNQVDTVYTDFSKAFDRMDHNVLLSKLDSMGFDGRLLRFLHAYLRDRPQYVNFRGHRSRKYYANSGAPQGSNLAPLLFLLFINDIGQNMSSFFLLFADDLKIFRIIRTVYDCMLLQNDLNTLSSWCLLNRLPLNIDKCSFFTFSGKHSSVNYAYSINNTPLNKTDSCKDLGIYFDQKLSFAYHIEMSVSSAKKMLGLICRSCKDFKTEKSFITLYDAYVRSRLEYGNLVWSPIHAVHIQSIESVQRQFMKYLSFKVTGVYPLRGTENTILLRRFHLLSLEDRRTYYACIFVYKLVNYLVDSPGLLSQLNFHVPRVNSRFGQCFYLATPRTNALRRSPLFSMCNRFNLCCRNMDANSVGLSRFRRELKALLFEAQ
ncbi:uncharacterized protein LOC123319186 [Coccinella septempunctata]|uniref:uncharacterized protein LOC123319186 n=1 Tax=Coccinella septempunctata TaxID=41139 RepID=UPI001D05EA21|nr:uncharacterized protein LOC123319186 [Coccinella septempunctata]